MERVGIFEKVSFEQYLKDFSEVFPSYNKKEIKEIYEHLKYPLRATTGSAGYDFFMPISIILNPKESIKIPTGFKVKIKEGWFLSIYPRSGLGFKYKLQLSNTVGIIDSDYYNSITNEGHILCKITNDNNENISVSLQKDKGFAQAIFMQYGITFDDEVNDERTSGFGSTDK